MTELLGSLDGLSENASDFWQKLFYQEGCPVKGFPVWVRKEEALVRSSIDLFHFILPDGDFWWNIVDLWNSATGTPGVERIHREVSLLAIYLSKYPSFRGEYSRFTNTENIRHLIRAAINMKVGPWLYKMFNPSMATSRYSLELARTNKITPGVDRQNITGCPEALYQIRLFDTCGKRPKYLARVGFNLHFEDGQRYVFSITNLQGIPDGKYSYQ